MTPIVSLGMGVTPLQRRIPRKRTKPILTNEQIRDLYAFRWSVTQEDAARMYGTSQSIVGRIWNRQAWRHVTEGMGEARDGWHERRGMVSVQRRNAI